MNKFHPFDNSSFGNVRRYLHLRHRTKHLVGVDAEVQAVIYLMSNRPIRRLVGLAAGNMEPVYSTVALFCTVQV